MSDTNLRESTSSIASYNLKALVLVGGYGTRLRPLTFTCPKPLVPFANKPILFHQLNALRAAGVNRVVLAVQYRAETLVKAIEAEYTDAAFQVEISVEDEPLGTAGPLGLARETLLRNADGSKTDGVFVLNSDVVCEFPFHKMIDFHMAHGGEGTILTTPVEEPSKYGVVLSADNGQIESFVEKPVKYVGNMINAGIYLVSPAFLDRIKPVPTSIERQIFPLVAADKQLYAMPLPGFWMDIGQPKDYLRGNQLYLQALSNSESKLIAKPSQYKNCHIGERVLIDATAQIGDGCNIGPDVVVGPGCIIENGVRLQSCTILAGARIRKSALVANAIIGWQSVVGEWAHVTEFSVLGQDVKVVSEIAVNNTIVCPHKGVKQSTLNEKII